MCLCHCLHHHHLQSKSIILAQFLLSFLYHKFSYSIYVAATNAKYEQPKFFQSWFSSVQFRFIYLLFSNKSQQQSPQGTLYYKVKAQRYLGEKSSSQMIVYGQTLWWWLWFLFNRKKPPKGPGYGRVGHLLWLVGGERKEKRKEKSAWWQLLVFLSSHSV